MLPSLAATLPLLIKYGYALLFIGAVIEGPIITILGAFLASQGSFNIVLVFLAVVVGDLAGDALYYAIGYFSSRFPRLLKFFGLTDERLKPVEDYYKEHGAKAMFFAKFTQTGFLALPAAGIIRMPIGKFMWYNTLGTLPKSLALCVIGYFFGYAYSQINAGLEKVSLVLGAIAIIVIFYVYRTVIAKPNGKK